MTEQDPGQTPDLLAAELALGLLDAEERRMATARRAREPQFDRACRRWEDRAVALMDGTGVAPGADLWSRIRDRLPANEDGGELALLRRSVRRWRSAAAACGAIALALGGTIVVERDRAGPPLVAHRTVPAMPIVAILTSADRQAIVSISFDPSTRRYVVASDAFHAGPHSAELWVIGADQIPRSLGLLSEARHAGQIASADGAGHIAPGSTLAISLEPLGGSTIGKPTGPVVLKGRVKMDTASDRTS